MGPRRFTEGIGGHDLALGSGSYDGMVGTGIYGRWKRGFVTASVQYSIRSEGDFEHQYANDLTWFGGPGFYLALTHDYTFALQAVVSGETKGKDTFNGVDDPDSAETLVYVGPQINFTWRSKLSALAGGFAGVPGQLRGPGPARLSHSGCGDLTVRNLSRSENGPSSKFQRQQSQLRQTGSGFAD